MNNYYHVTLLENLPNAFGNRTVKLFTVAAKGSILNVLKDFPDAILIHHIELSKEEYESACEDIIGRIAPINPLSFK